MNELDHEKQKLNKVLQIFVNASHNPQCQPTILLRKEISDIEMIKSLISAAYNDQPIIIYPTFSNKFRALAGLIEKGLVHVDEKGTYRFSF